MLTRARRIAIAVALATLVLGLVAGTTLAADKFVTMYANEYRPGVVTINTGDSVTWVNDDDVEHDAVGRGWKTSLLGYYESDSVTFTRAGRYAYSCSIHPQMRSAVVVRGRTAGATVPPTDTVISPDRGGPAAPWVIPMLVLAGSVVLAALTWSRETRPGR